MKGSIVIYGAGAIGRGFLAPIFSKLGYKIYFVDKNSALINILKSRRSYKTAFSNHGVYKIVQVKYEDAFLLGEEDAILDSADFVFSCVGPNNIREFSHKLKDVKTIISFENERESTEKIKILSGNKNCYFGIPDVIASNDCPEELKDIDPLCLVSESGEIAIEAGNSKFPKQIRVYSEDKLEKYWNCKFYLHNTPHAAAAFLGKVFGVKYIHESMKIPFVNFILYSIMESTKKAMKIKSMADDKFIDYYAKKEIERFKDPLLYDPIERVGRDPIRKLRNHDRLIQSSMFIHETKQDIESMAIVIEAVIQDALNNYHEELFKILGKKPTKYLILRDICELDECSTLFQKLIWQNSLQKIEKSGLILSC